MQDRNKINIFNIFDIVVVALGALVGMVVTVRLNFEPASDWTDYTIMACAMALLILKRAVLPAPMRPPHPSTAARLAYMFTGILGTLSLIAAVVIMWSGLQDGISLSLAVREASMVGLLGGGLFSAALVLDWLRPPHEAS